MLSSEPVPKSCVLLPLHYTNVGGSSMAQAKQRFKRKRSKAALPVLGAAGVSLTIAGGASANAPAVDVPSQSSGPRILLAEEEVFDVSLSTFYVFDKEGQFGPGVRLAAGRGGCGGCGGCGHGGGCGGCGHGGGCGGCGHGGGCGGCHAGGCHIGGCGGCGCAARGCRGCGGCGCGVGLWFGGCGGCGGGCGTCYQWDPVLLRWVYVCY